MSIVRAASSLAAKDLKFYSSIDFSLQDEIADCSLHMSDLVVQVLESSIIVEQDKCDTLDDNSVSLVIDLLMERVSSLSELLVNNSRGVTRLGDVPDEQDVPTPVIPIKPQDALSMNIDNTDNHPFRPKLKWKPHALTSLPNEEEPTAVLAHPYQVEIETSAYPNIVYSHCSPIEPVEWDQSSSTWISRKDELIGMCAELKQCTEIAVDLEHHDYRSYYGLTCLMQVSSRNRDWLIDTLALREELSLLNDVFADPKILKVFHGARMDIIWLQRDLGLYVVSLFDTYFASKELGLPRHSLAFLLENFAKFKTSKKYQLADWRLRPLTPMMARYARADTHFLLHIYDQLRLKLLARGVDSIDRVLESSRSTALRKFEYIKFRNTPANARSEQWILDAQITADEHFRLRKLAHWRDNIARTEDESFSYVAPNNVLIRLSLLGPHATHQRISQIVEKFPLLKERINEISFLLLLERDSANSTTQFQQEARQTYDTLNYSTKLLAGNSRMWPDEDAIFARFEHSGKALRTVLNSQEILKRYQCLDTKPPNHEIILEDEFDAAAPLNREPELEEEERESAVADLPITILSPRNALRPSPINRTRKATVPFDYENERSTMLGKTANRSSFDPFKTQGEDGFKTRKRLKKPNSGRTMQYTKRT